MKLRREWGSRALGAVAALALAATAGDLAWTAAGALKRPGLADRIFAPQGESCVVRSDACALALALRSMKAGRFDMSAELNPEVYQRVVELSYPERIARGAAVRIDLCRRAPHSLPAARVPDTERPADRDADFCVVDRR